MSDFTVDWNSVFFPRLLPILHVVPRTPHFKPFSLQKMGVDVASLLFLSLNPFNFRRWGLMWPHSFFSLLSVQIFIFFAEEGSMPSRLKNHGTDHETGIRIPNRRPPGANKKQDDWKTQQIWLLKDTPAD